MTNAAEIEAVKPGQSLKEQLNAVQPSQVFELYDGDTRQDGTYTRSDDGEFVTLVTDQGFDLGNLGWDVFVEGFELLAGPLDVVILK